MENQSCLIKPAGFFMEEVVERFHPSSKQPVGFPLPWRAMHQIRVRPAELSVYAGVNGHGKSLFTSQIALAAAMEGKKVVIASFEMPAPKTLWRMVRQITCKPFPTHAEIRDAMAWITAHILIYDYVGRGQVEHMLDGFKRAVEFDGACQFIIDSLMKCGLAEDDYSRQKFLVEDFHNFAMSNHAHVHLVAHARKAKSEADRPGKMDISGSAGITNIADNVYTVWRNKDKESKRNECQFYKRPLPPDFDTWPDCQVDCVKSREQGGDVERLYNLWYDNASLQYIDGPGEVMTFTNEAPF